MYLESYFDRIAEAIDIRNALVECMRWRGFWVELKEDQLWLLHWTDDDLHFLRDCGVSANCVENGNIARIEAPQEMSVCRNVFFSGAMNDWIGAPQLADTFEVFKACEQCEPIPTRHLDPGVALLVKALGLAGVYTVMSCDGHLARPPMIHFRTEWDLKWCKYVLTQVGMMLEIDYPDRLWSFIPDGSAYPSGHWLHYFLTWHGHSHEEGWFKCFCEIQMFARKLIESAPDFCRAKMAVLTLGDLTLLLSEQAKALKEMRREWDKQELLAAGKVTDEQALDEVELDRLRREALDFI